MLLRFVPFGCVRVKTGNSVTPSNVAAVQLIVTLSPMDAVMLGPSIITMRGSSTVYCIKN